ncbi:23S rRNA (uracil(1939)-C(5))-methyltransferase RlmD [Butyrivibrio sp. FCS014]|uniref:23S rRNA (uracil(1939)-C(5))-methyltransferase RlmD n=1 Tax=Butyrivibrio sp. FCS014 TaxID=1408304 RepID=UPI0006848C87|nr:23S rRNA (uracil(1939)-C(5))-methyltransferase RlmD [Butyrivibrio sp. FCS014]
MVKNNNSTGHGAKSLCPVFKKCGACQMIDTPYKKQLKIKHARVQELLEPYCKVESFIGMESPEHYRCKVHAVFTHDKKGNPLSGIYREGSHEVVPVESCLLEDQKADAIIASIRGMLKSFKIKTYDEDNGYGLLRHVLIRIGRNTGEIMVVLVTVSPIFPSKNNFVKALRKEHPEITTIVLNVNDKQTSMILGDKEKPIYGPGFIYDICCGMKFKISPKSFYQVNPIQQEVLYNTAIEMADLKGDEVALDCYSGVGTIGLIASPHVKEVISVELNKDAVKDAILNAKINEVKNITFYQNDATRFMQQMADSGDSVDLVFMDPPRSGSTPEFITSMVSLSPKKIVYISCSPESLANDLKLITKGGYKAQKAVPVDMFPFTRGVETVVLLTKED